MSDTPWGSDVPISMPVPPGEEILIDMHGFGFTMAGLRHNISESDLEDMIHPTYAPQRMGEDG